VGLTKLKFDKKFQPCAAEPGDELYPNGIFVFNISRLLAFVQAHPDRFPVEQIELADIPDYGGSHLDEASIRAADLSRPILLAEIAPGRYNVIDGHHRIAKARHDGARTVAGQRLWCPEHVRFLTSSTAYQKYIDYWNSKVDEATRDVSAGSPVAKKGKPSPEVQRQRRTAFYHGLSRDTLRNAARRAKTSRKTRKPADHP
jgi:hypothetical protein